MVIPQPFREDDLSAVRMGVGISREGRYRQLNYILNEEHARGYKGMLTLSNYVFIILFLWMYTQNVSVDVSSTIIHKPFLYRDCHDY